MLKFTIPIESGGLKKRQITNTNRADGKFSAIIESLEPHYPTIPLRGALDISMFFVFARPRNQIRTGKFSGRLKSSAPTHMLCRPTVDTLVTCFLGCMVEYFYENNDQVFSVHTEKLYSDDVDAESHVHIEIKYIDKTRVLALSPKPKSKDSPQNVTSPPEMEWK